MSRKVISSSVLAVFAISSAAYFIVVLAITRLFTCSCTPPVASFMFFLGDEFCWLHPLIDFFTVLYY